MKSGCSLPKASALCVPDLPATTSCHQQSRPSAIVTGWPVRLRTTTFWTLGVPASARSTFAFSSTIFPRRQPPSAVMMTLAWQSFTRSLMASLEKPPKITVWMTPRRAQASIAIAASGTIGM